MTDNDIIKALECCVNGECPNCPLSHNNTGVYNERCGENLMQNALDLINRQKAELKQYAKEQHELMIEKDELFDIAEKQKAEIERLKKDIDIIQSANVELYSALDKARAEAITEFEERLKANAYVNSTITGYHYMVVDVSDIDQTAKEMKEGVNNA